MGKFSRDKRDIYYRRAKEQGWRARSAFKLLQIDQKFNILKGVTKAVDLCAAPGSWSQVLSRKLYLNEEININPEKKLFYTDEEENSGPSKKCKERPPPHVNEHVKIVAVDLQAMAPLPGVIQLQGDITQYSTAEAIIKQFEGDHADLVVCDGAPDVTGLHALDNVIQMQLVVAAVHIACNVLKKGGTFVAKVFRSPDNYMLINKMMMLFSEVVITKPSSSRNSSLEAFLVCEKYAPPEDFDPKLLSQYLDSSNRDFSNLDGINRKAIPFIVCGDLSGYDSDTTYSLQEAEGDTYEYHLPVQPPINPPYAEAIAKVNEGTELTKKLDSENCFSFTNTAEDDSELFNSEAIRDMSVDEIEKQSMELWSKALSNLTSVHNKDMFSTKMLEENLPSVDQLMDRVPRNYCLDISGYKCTCDINN